MAKKPAPKKAAKPASKKAVKPVKKATPAKKSASKKVVKPVAKKAAKPAPKKPAPKPVAKKPAPAPKKAVAVKPAPAKKAAPTPTKVAAKPVVTSQPKPTPAPPAAAKKAAAAKSAPAPKKSEKHVKEEKSAAPKPLVQQTSAPVMPKATPMVKVQVSTLESSGKDRYSDHELEEFRQIINVKLDEARKDYELLKQTLANTDNNGTEDTSPSFKMIEDGSETLSREETAQLASRQEKFIKHLEDALLRIRNKTYGICRVTGRLISKERLRLVPHATLSIEAKQQMSN